MPRQQSFFDFRRSQVDADQIRDLLATINPASTRATLGITGANTVRLTMIVLPMILGAYLAPT
jgi:predicted Zn-dependent protease